MNDNEWGTGVALFHRRQRYRDITCMCNGARQYIYIPGICLESGRLWTAIGVHPTTRRVLNYQVPNQFFSTITGQAVCGVRILVVEEECKTFV